MPEMTRDEMIEGLLHEITRPIVTSRTQTETSASSPMISTS
jgi:hypothetical protein